MDDRTKQKQQLQNIGENLGFQSKMFFKSFDLSIFIQILLMILPFGISLISLCYQIEKYWDISALFLGFFSVVYYLRYGQYSRLYKQRGEKYLVLYKDVENYYKSTNDYDSQTISNFIKEQNQLGELDKPNVHFLSKRWVDIVLEKEMKYGNEDIVRWKQ